MKLAVSDLAGTMTVTIPGTRLDAAAAEAFKTELCGIIDGGARSIVLDLSQIEFLDSSGLGAIVACYKHMAGRGSMDLANPQEPVMKVLRLTRMSKIFTIHERAG